MTEEFTVFNIDAPEAQVRIPAGTCLLAYRGSIAHGMYVPPENPDSIDDVDLMGVVLGAPEHYLALREWGSRGTREIKEGRYDCVFYEVRKLVSLLLQGNPNVLGLLWTRHDHYLHREASGNRLIENRRLFVGKHVYNAFAGYAHAQLEKMESRDPAELRRYIAITNELKARGAHPNHKGEKIPYPPDHSPCSGEGFDALQTSTEKLLQGLRSFQKKGENIGYLGDKRKHLVLQHGYDAKNAAHLVRLLRMCVEFLETGELHVYRERDRDELLAIKRGQWGLGRVKAHAADLFEYAREARDRSQLPDQPDRAGAERLLIEILGEHLEDALFCRGGAR